MSRFKSLLKKLAPVSGFNYRVQIASRFSSLDTELKKLSVKSHFDYSDYIALLQYFVEGIDAYKTPEATGVLYPGEAGTRGTQVESLEGFARSAPTLAAALIRGHKSTFTISTGDVFHTREYLISAIANGTDASSKGFWGEIQDLDQRAVEAGDIAVTAWLLNQNEATRLPDSIKKHLIVWLDKINHVQLYGGNWILFRLIVNCVLLTLGLDKHKSIQQDFATFKGFYKGDGWFGDGEDGLLDYYNAWQMHYYLFWFTEIYPDYEGAFISETIEKFSQGYQYFFSLNGLPMFGRSAIYRCAAATPLLINAHFNPSFAPLSKRAQETVWRHFILHDAVKGGTCTQGYYASFPDLMENYSGRGSVLWSLRSLCIAFYFPTGHIFWQCEPAALPIEKGSYEVNLAEAGFIIRGDHATGQTSVTQTSPPFKYLHKEAHVFRTRNIVLKIAEFVLRRPLRHENLAAKYSRMQYFSDQPFYITKK